MYRIVIMLFIALTVMGCTTTHEELATIGGKTFHAMYARPAGAPAATMLVEESFTTEVLADGTESRKSGAVELKASWSQKDMATTAVEGVFSTASSAVYGLSWEAIRGPDKHEEHISVDGGGDGDTTVTGGGASAESSSTSNSKSKSKSTATQSQKQSQSQKHAKVKHKAPKKKHKKKPAPMCKPKKHKKKGKGHHKGKHGSKDD